MSGMGDPTHPEQDRLLTVREMALLQGFPPDYVFEGRLSAKYNQIGDAVPPLISTEIARHLLMLMTEGREYSQALAHAAASQLLLPISGVP